MVKTYLFLIAANIFEVAGTMLTSFSKLYKTYTNSCFINFLSLCKRQLYMQHGVVLEFLQLQFLVIYFLEANQLATGALIFFYVCAFFCLSIVVTKLPLAVVYATWCGLGIFTIAILGYIFYGQSWQAI